MSIRTKFRIYKITKLGLITKASIIFVLIAFLSNSAFAGDMRCGTHLISDNKRPGPSKAKVKRVCGAPYSESGNRWVYYKGRSVYRLRFSETSGLVSIKREIER